MGDKITPDKLAKTYLRIRAERSMLSAKYQRRRWQPYTTVRHNKTGMLDHCEDHNVESVRTSEGLFFRSTKRNTGSVNGMQYTNLLWKKMRLSYLTNVSIRRT